MDDEKNEMRKHLMTVKTRAHEYRGKSTAAPPAPAQNKPDISKMSEAQFRQYVGSLRKRGGSKPTRAEIEAAVGRWKGLHGK